MSGKLVAFFSRRGENYAVGNISEGNAEHIAKVIKELTDADVFEIRTKRQYSADYMTCVNEAKEELEKEERPELSDLPKSIDGYSDIFLCFPNWWGTFPRAVASFLENMILAKRQYGLSARTREAEWEKARRNLGKSPQVRM